MARQPPAARRRVGDLGRGHAVIWYGPPMGAKSFLTARLMEVWATGRCGRGGGCEPGGDRRLRHIAQLASSPGLVLRGARRDGPARRRPPRAHRPVGDVWPGPRRRPDSATAGGGLLPRRDPTPPPRRHRLEATGLARHCCSGQAFAGGRPTRRPRGGSDVPGRDRPRRRRAHRHAGRRGARNVLSRELTTELVAALDAADADPGVRVVVLTNGAVSSARGKPRRALAEHCGPGPRTPSIRSPSSGVSAIRRSPTWADRRPLRRRGRVSRQASTSPWRS